MPPDFCAVCAAFAEPVRQVLFQVHPSIKVRPTAVKWLANTLVRMAVLISAKVSKLRESLDGDTADRQVQEMVRELFTGELGKHAVSEGTKAVTKFSAADAALQPEERAGLQFPVKVCGSLLDRTADANASDCAEVYLAACLEYMAAEVLELAGNAARDHRTNYIALPHIHVAIANDDELKVTLFERINARIILANGTAPTRADLRMASRRGAGVGADDSGDEGVNTDVDDDDGDDDNDDLVDGGHVGGDDDDDDGQSSHSSASDN